MSATTAPQRVSNHPSNGGEVRRPIHRFGAFLAITGVVFVLAWIAWNVWIAAYIAGAQ